MVGLDRRFSVRQAAFIADMDEKGVDRLLFETDLRARERVRELDGRDLVFLGICRAHEADLTRAGRRRIYEALRVAISPTAPEFVVGVLRVEVAAILRLVGARAELVERAQAAVVEDPGVLGGEPVVAGTRIPARSLAAKLARGMTEAELVRHHPTLTEEQVRLAALWAELNPKRGRPPAARPWRGEEVEP